jgi:hypothetical protein
MPLNAERELRQLGQMYRLNQSVSGMDRRLHPIAEPVQALSMQGIDANFFLLDQAGKPGARQQFDASSSRQPDSATKGVRYFLVMT